ncbi:Bicarbonate transport system permease protein CmpB [Baekduia alba]|uniref:ABC transporter permease n=1 Tax=Baekduia alba TaxID=2997333 RepID=UPI002340984D|nr:ABC transporter permease [Baekduia alba]WCB91526.1 Bicarbonate transport system permease protein CmpB [Baekduia alba]
MRELTARAGAGLQRVWLVVALLAIWQVAASAAASFYVPPVADVLKRFSELWLSGDPQRLFVSEQFVDEALPSLARLAAGWSTAALVGIGLGLVLGRSERAAAFFDPLVRFGIAVPPPALLPFAIVLIGIGSGMSIFLIAFGTVWPILLNTIDGARRVDPLVEQTSRALHLSRRRFVTSVLLPAASPQIMAGVRVSLATGLILMIISELYAATDGIGFVIVQAQRSFLVLDMWAGIVLLALLGLVINIIYVRIERRVLHWHRGARAIDR